MITDDTLMGRKRKNMEAPKEIKVRVPVGSIIKLHFVKVSTGQDISQTVTKALDQYFDNLGRHGHALRKRDEPPDRSA